MIVLDYVSQPADFSTMKARGVSGAVVYVAPASWNWPKTIKPGQLQAAFAVGFPLAFNFEQGTQDYLGGYSRGQAHGAAIEQAMRDLGLPADQPVYLSVDTSVYPASFQRAVEYFQGARSTTRHPLDFYGENALGEHLVAAGLVTRLWMSESTSFPGNASPTPHVALQQHYGRSVPNLGGSYDVNDVLHADWGQYPRPTAPKPPPPPKPDVPQPAKVTADMATAKAGIITTVHRGFGQHTGVFDAGQQVKEAVATIHGPDPHAGDPSSPDDWWPSSIGATVRCQVRGNHVPVTVSTPNWKIGDPAPAVHVIALV